jgi:hypothetical protein
MEPSEEQQLLKQAAARLAAAHGGAERRRRLREDATGFDASLWRQMAELGWLGLPLPAEHGGLDGGAVDVAILMEELGRALVATPYLYDVVLCAGLLAQGGNGAQHLPALLAGETHWALACVEDGARFEPLAPRTTARRDGEDWVLDGRKIAVPNAHAAAQLIVSARCTDGVTGLFIVAADAAGVQREPLALVDGSRGAHLGLAGVRIRADARLDARGDGAMLLESALDRAAVAMGAEALGAMEALLEQTVAYTKTRVQFGQPIGAFQALQHRMADMYLHCQAMRSLVVDAAIAQAEGGPRAARAAAALKVKLGEAGRFVAQQAVQLHGGIGMTDELAVGHHFKRLLFLDTLFGDAGHHLRRYIALD